MTNAVSNQRWRCAWMATVVLVVGLLTICPPAWAVPPAPTGAGAGTLEVASDPEGASVYVDGDLQGTTPLTVDRLSEGDHRVSVAKDGYLENSRVVAMGPGDSRSVRVRMTPAPASSRRPGTRMQQDPGPNDGHKKSSKLKWIVPLVAAGGAGAYFALRDTNDPPVAGTVNASPSTGLAAATAITFSAPGASDPDGDSLSFSWSFGDGGTGSGESTTHTYTTAGTFNVQVTVSDGKKSVTATGSVTIRDLGGLWRGAITSGGASFSTNVTFTQSGTSLAGSVTFPSVVLPAGSLSGSVSAQRSVRFSVSVPGFQQFTFTGSADESISRLTGTVAGSGFVGEPWTLSR